MAMNIDLTPSLLEAFVKDSVVALKAEPQWMRAINATGARVNAVNCIDAYLELCVLGDLNEPWNELDGITQAGNLLYALITSGNVPAFRLFLKHAHHRRIHFNIPPGVVSPMPPIVHAIASSQTLMVEAMIDSRLPLIDLNAACPLDGPKLRGMTALMCAIVFENERVVDMLLAAGERVDVEKTDAFGLSALLCTANTGAFRIAAKLLAAGASTSVCDVDGNTALDLSAWNDATRRVIAEHVEKRTLAAKTKHDWRHPRRTMPLRRRVHQSAPG